MKALSIQNPYGWLICKGYKDIENRDWDTEFRGRIYVHVGKRYYCEPPGSIWDKIMDISGTEIYQEMIEDARSLPLGGIIGEVDIVDCVVSHCSVWFTGQYGFILANPVLYQEPIPCRGRLGFFKVPGGS